MKTLYLCIAALLITTGCAQQPKHEPQPTTVDFQDDASDWKRSPHMHAYYDETVKTFAHGTDVDVDAYEARSFAIFREFARASGASEEAMVDHLKLIRVRSSASSRRIQRCCKATMRSGPRSWGRID